MGHRHRRDPSLRPGGRVHLGVSLGTQSPGTSTFSSAAASEHVAGLPRQWDRACPFARTRARAQSAPAFARSTAAFARRALVFAQRAPAFAWLLAALELSAPASARSTAVFARSTLAFAQSVPAFAHTSALHAQLSTTAWPGRGRGGAHLCFAPPSPTPYAAGPGARPGRGPPRHPRQLTPRGWEGRFSSVRSPGCRRAQGPRSPTGG